jgi:hypothetical protein
VTFNFDIYDESGLPDDVDETDVSFSVYDNGVPLLEDLSVTQTAPGSFEGSFELTEANLGAADFSGQEPKELSLKISTVAEGVIKEQPVSVGRWGCDRCHVDYVLAQELYPWSLPTGGPLGPHGWGNILGRYHNPPTGFDLSFLAEAERTHTPAVHLVSSSFHEKTYRKQPAIELCTPCHQGSGRVRYPYLDGVSMPFVSMAMSEAVECTFCHGIEGGYYDPENTVRWVDNAGYISADHRHNNVPLIPHTNRDPYLARQTCSNPGCHGHIDDDAVGEVLHNKPNCRDCHGIHNDDF